MKTQTKSTYLIGIMFIIELLPIPFSSIYSLYAIRKRPDWFPDFVDSLYADKADNIDAAEASLPENHNPMTIRKKYTLILSGMFLVDLLIPVVIPTALYVVRVRPKWFKILVLKLYSDKLQLGNKTINTSTQEDPQMMEAFKQKLLELERQNMDFAKSLSAKNLNPPLSKQP